MNELLETKAMIFEEISGKLIQKADFLSQIEFLEMKLQTLKENKSTEIEFYLDQKFLKENIEKLCKEISKCESEESILNQEALQIEILLKTIKNKTKSIKIEIDFKNKEKNKKFSTLAKEKLIIENNIQTQLQNVGANDLCLILQNISNILLENLDGFDNEEQIFQKLSHENLLEDLQRIFVENKTDVNIQENLKKEIKIYFQILEDYSIFRNKFRKFCSFYIFI